MGKKKTHEEFIKELKEKDFKVEPIEEYKGAKEKIQFKCTICNHVWFACPSNILSGFGCPKCAAKRTSESQTKSQNRFIDDMLKINPFIKLIGHYINANTNTDFYCTKCGFIWNARPNNLLHGKGCPKCAGNIKLTHEEFVLKVKEINPNIEVIGTYINARVKITFGCKIDGHKWDSKPTHILSGHGCPKCSESQGEKQISQWLKKHKIYFIAQKRFCGCKDEYLLPFDFYIPDKNICIEYDGKQHFEPVDFAGKGKEWAEKQLSITRRHDKIKNDYCNNNNICLIRIPYFKDINNELNFLLI